ncbi:MAG: hypothetical protein V4812_05325 [Pseudomonadota bacterium]
MTHPPRDAEREEQTLLEHYREHSRAAPSAGLDARILAAARAAQAPTVRARSWPVRVQAWLFAGPVRWSVALGSLAVFGLGLGLSLNTLERAPGRYDQAEPRPMAATAPLPAAPAAAPVVAPAAAEPQKRLKVERSSESEPMAELQADKAESLTEQGMAHNQAQRAPVLQERTVSPLKPAASAPQLNAELRVALQQVLALRREGQTQRAEQQLEALRLRYPDLDLAAELLRLQGAPVQE